ncbi:hypothetical protein AB0M87_12335 [Streptomyces sp. NPDC051320]|uniref:hypothetical protein n=1 Tax=Streptomyces sp. NPDC051320 TaxID=3154644 RepID=UPI003415A1BB
MKVQERTGAGNHRVPSPAQSSGERLPSVTRERKPALAALAVLLILVGALGATVLVLRAGNRVEVVKLKAHHDIQAGQSLTTSDVESVMVADDASINYVPYKQLRTLEKLQAKNALVGGTVLIGDMFADKTGTPAGKAVVGLSLKDGQYPADIKAGDTVTAYRVGDKVSGSNGSSNDNAQTGGSGGAAIVERATVAAAPKVSSGTISSGNRSVTLTVNAADAAALAQASANGEVALVLVPNNG